MLAILALSLFETPTRARVVGGALVLVAALFTKQTTLDAALAGLAFVWLAAPRFGLLAGGIVAGLGTGVLVAIMGATGGAFWLNVVQANNNPFEFEQLAKYLANFGILHAVLLSLAGAEWWRNVRQRTFSPWVLYFPVALAFALTVGKWGAGESYFLAAIAATCVLAAARLARLIAAYARDVPAGRHTPMLSNAKSARRFKQESRGRTLLGQVGQALRRIETQPTLLALALLVQMLLLAHGPLSNRVAWLPDRGPQAMFLGRPLNAAESTALAELTELVRASPGPVLSEEPGIAIAAGKPVVGNATQLRNLHDQGRWNPAALVADVEAQRFGVVILNAQLFPAPVLVAIGQHYSLDHTVELAGSTYRVLLPRGS
jgi:hypothetical protein